MRTKLLSTLRASVAVLFVAVQLPLMSLLMSTASAAAVSCNDANSQNTNEVCYWQAQGYGTCVKDDGPFTGTTYTLPTAPAGQAYSLLVVNGGSDDATYTNPTAGTPYTAPLNNGGHFPTISHAIYCTQPTTTSVEPTGVTFIDLCGTGSDTYTVPSQTGVTYHLGTAGGAVIAANTYPGSGTVTVVAVANANYTLTGVTSWTHTFTDVACDSHVTPAAVTFNDVCGTANDTFDVPTTTGVTYHLNDANGAVVTGTGNTGTGSVTVVAVANQGFVLDGTTSWSHDFTNVACETHVTPGAVTFSEVCGTANDTYTVPSTTGVTYHLNDANGATVTGTNAGTGSVTVVAVANQGFVLDGTTSWSHTFTNEECPPPPTDLCTNLPGNQSELPVGFVQQNDKTCKVIICHATASIHNPYVRITVSLHSVDGNLGDDNGHGDHFAQHTGPVFNITMDNGDNWGDIIPPVPGIHDGLNWDTVGQAIWNNKCKVTVPPVDVCPNIPGIQTTVPEGKVKNNDGNCVTPPVDVCPNIQGLQTEVPEGMVKDDDGNCVTPPVIVDVCPNIEGNQSEVPAGMVVDINGNCITGGQGGETPPVLVTVVEEQGAVLGASTTAAPAQLVNTGSTVLMNLFAGMFLVSIAALVTILSRKSGGSSMVSSETTTGATV